MRIILDPVWWHQLILSSRTTSWSPDNEEKRTKLRYLYCIKSFTLLHISNLLSTLAQFCFIEECSESFQFSRIGQMFKNKCEFWVEIPLLHKVFYITYKFQVFCSHWHSFASLRNAAKVFNSLELGKCLKINESESLSWKCRRDIRATSPCRRDIC